MPFTSDAWQPADPWHGDGTAHNNEANHELNMQFQSRWLLWDRYGNNGGREKGTRKELIKAKEKEVEEQRLQQLWRKVDEPEMNLE